jgi:hypothetical protein
VISLELAASPACISVNDADTIWMSRIAMNMPNTIDRKANSRRGSIWSAESESGMAGAARPAVMVGEVAIG